MAVSKGRIVLMGSGEFTSTMVEVHKELLASSGEPPEACFLDTPAGFQLNVDEISRKAAAYFRDRVGHPLSVASLKSAEDPPYRVEQALLALRRADFILMGPGSPTYAVRQWESTPVPQILAERVAAGGCLVAASAAALTVGRFTLPVYEIYKVGESLHWVDGTDLLGRCGFPLVVVPHWNNAEGGTHDTRFCYMGEPRFRHLEELLPAEVGVLGIDEHTACALDLDRGVGTVKGIGGVTVRRRGLEARFEQGSQFDLRVLSDSVTNDATLRTPTERPALGQPAGSVPVTGASFWEPVRTLEAEFQLGLEKGSAAAAANALLELDRYLWNAQTESHEESSLADAREVLREMVVLLATRLASGPSSTRACLAPLVDPLLELRESFRRAKRWADADAVRDCLEQAGVAVADTERGPTWHLT